MDQTIPYTSDYFPDQEFTPVLPDLFPGLGFLLPASCVTIEHSAPCIDATVKKTPAQKSTPQRISKGAPQFCETIINAQLELQIGEFRPAGFKSNEFSKPAPALLTVLQIKCQTQYVETLVAALPSPTPQCPRKCSCSSCREKCRVRVKEKNARYKSKLKRG
jgi:hypothetical protein